MKAAKTKAEIRDEIEHQIASFIRQGGAVSAVQPGDSGRELGQALPPVAFEKKPESTRTPVQDVVKAIEARKHPPRKPVKPRHKSPKKILITDDFGDPVRWVWSDE
jgi:SutA RNAP-binding domain